MKTTAYIGIGSNIGDPRGQVEQAIAALDRLPDTKLKSASPLYQSRPQGPVDQPEFVNAAAAIDTGLEALDLLEHLHAIEQAQGRFRDGTRWGPRQLDLDILLYGDEAFSTSGLTVPHPELTRRSFVLYPLADIAPDLEIPGAGSLQQLLAEMPADDLEVLA